MSFISSQLVKSPLARFLRVSLSVLKSFILTLKRIVKWNMRIFRRVFVRNNVGKFGESQVKKLL